MPERNLTTDPLDPATESPFTSWAAVAAAMGLPAASQPLDSDLTAIAALTTTTYGRSLLTLANAGALATSLASTLAGDAAFTSEFAPLPSGVTTVTGASYTFVLADSASPVVASSASAQVFTVPPNASVPYPIGTILTVAQSGAGATTIVPGAGVTVNPAPGSTLTTAGAGAVVTLLKTGTNTWQAASNGWARTEVLFVPAMQMRTVRAFAAMDRAPYSQAESSPPVLLFDAAGDESASFTFVPPWGWSTVRVDLLWLNGAASSGNVVWDFWYQNPVGDGDSFSQGSTSVLVTSAAPTTITEMQSSTLLTSLAVAPSKVTQLGVRRQGFHASDTLPNDAGVLGALLVRLT